MKKIIIFFLVYLSIGIIDSSAQDVIYKNDGTEIKAKIIELTTETIKYKNFDQREGPIRNLLFSEVYMIIYEDGTREVIKKNQQTKENETKQRDNNVQISQNASKSESNYSSGDKCMLGTNDADNLHGKEAAHLLYGLAFGGFAVIGAAIANPTPEKGNSTTLMSENRELFNDPAYRNCYTTEAKKNNVSNAAIGWATWVLVVLIVVANY